MKKGYIRVSKAMTNDLSNLRDIIGDSLKTGKPIINKTKEELFGDWNKHPKEDPRNHFA